MPLGGTHAPRLFLGRCSSSGSVDWGGGPGRLWVTLVAASHHQRTGGIRICSSGRMCRDRRLSFMMFFYGTSAL